MGKSEIVVDGEVWVPKMKPSNVKIVILQRGWVMVGNYLRSGDMCYLENASVIRMFGTTKGLGELKDGPTANTKLDPCGNVQFHILTTIAIIDCVDGKWK